jgi:hypothetical protein
MRKFTVDKCILAEDWMKKLIEQSINCGQEEVSVDIGGVIVGLSVNQNPRHFLDHEVRIVSQPKPFSRVPS